MGKEIVMLCTAVGVMLIGCGVLITALILPPPGEIDNSVLVAFGEMSTFSGALFGVHLRRKENKKSVDIK